MIIDKKNERILLIIVFVLCKASYDYGFIKLISFDVDTCHPNFALLKYIVGWVFCLLLFFPIDFEQRKTSSFFLAMILVLQILPITTIYSFCEGDSFFYFELCLSFLLCEILVRFIRFDDNALFRNVNSSNILRYGLLAVAVAVFVYMVLLNGVPSFSALNIYDVYDLRSSAPSINKYFGYALQWTMYIIMPVALSFSIQKKKYIVSLFLIMSVLLMYLYTGNKTQLFSIFMVIACTVFSEEKRSTNLLLFLLMTAIVFLTLLPSILKISLFDDLYSLFIRRCCFVPSVNKFSYYDFFSNHPKLGIYGIFPTWLVPYDGYYNEVQYSFEISSIYYGKPEMNSNTGFLVEGFARFGHLGMIIEMCVFAMLIKLFDSLQSRTNYQTTVGCFAYSIFALADMFLLNSFILGPWMIVVLFFILYSSHGDKAFERTK